ncbi:hypothetical protein QAD02_000507 [Eretmocerus hayati]|uniref:Uncharacterized protein n=1 Tax=Eretmocerus hayati TaxID=131215 RepID=A0ACC2NDM1_9HYME|nr:hypothetical protein QAD02_000507 [Eretmocerus hayati]
MKVLLPVPNVIAETPVAQHNHPQLMTSLIQELADIFLDNDDQVQLFEPPDQHDNMAAIDDLVQLLGDIFVDGDHEEEEDLPHDLVAVVEDIFEQEAKEEKAYNFLRTKIFRKILRDSSNPFEGDPEQFRNLYRFPPAVGWGLFELMAETLQTNNRTKIPVLLQFCIGLRFMAEGPFQKSLAQDYNHAVSQTLISRILNHFFRAICSLRDNFIKFPSTPEVRRTIQEKYQAHMRIPGILGAVDGFTVRIRRLHDHEEAFANYHEGPSLNVQIVSDSEQRITGLRIEPGSNNDIFNWLFSQVRETMVGLRANAAICEREGYYYLLAESGYTPSTVLLTPVENAPVGSLAARYTTEHCRTRSMVERTIGAVSGVFIACNRARKLFYRPKIAARIVTACAFLHNVIRIHGFHGEYFGDRFDNANVAFDHENADGYHAGLAERDFLINLFYH